MRSCASASVSPRLLISSFTSSIHVFLGLPLGLFPGTSRKYASWIGLLSSLRTTYPNHRNLDFSTQSITVFRIPSRLKIESDGMRSIKVTPHIIQAMRLSVESNLCLCSNFSVQVSQEYVITGRTQAQQIIPLCFMDNHRFPSKTPPWI